MSFVRLLNAFAAVFCMFAVLFGHDLSTFETLVNSDFTVLEYVLMAFIPINTFLASLD